MKKCLILLSGGVDSAVVLWWAKKRGWEVATLSFFFPGRKKGEIKALWKLRKLAGCKENYEVHLPFLDAPKSMNLNYIPKRNLMFYGIAASLAEKVRSDFILGGHYQRDGEIFPDARKSYLRQLERLVQVGGKTNFRIRMIFPFIDSSKSELIKTGATLQVPFQSTWSCSLDGARHCWKCSSCEERRAGFRDAKVKDPLNTNYES